MSIATPRIGEKLGPIEFTPDSEYVDEYADCTGAVAYLASRRALKDHFGHDIAPCTVADAEMGSALVRQRYGSSLGASLHASQTFEMWKPLAVGERCRITGHVRDLYERRGLQFMDVASECRTPSGGLVKGRYVRAFGIRGDREGSQRSAKRPRPTVDSFLTDNGADFGRVRADGARHMLSAGEVLRGHPITVTGEMTRRYALLKDPHRPSTIHTSASAAGARGYESPIVKGLMLSALEADYFLSVFGPQWYEGGRMDTRYLRPVAIDTELSLVAVVLDGGERRGDESRLATGLESQGTLLTSGKVMIDRSEYSA